jgi:hypothetical protein
MECTICKIYYNDLNKYFHKDKNRKNGHQKTCKKCKCKKMSDYKFIKNPSKKIMSLPNEEWKFIKGTNNKYMISNLGRVKSLQTRHEKIIVQICRTYNREKHWYVSITKPDKTEWKPYIYKLVEESFLELNENKNYIIHIDGDLSNNKVENLLQCTCQEYFDNQRKIKNNVTNNDLKE